MPMSERTWPWNDEEDTETTSGREMGSEQEEAMPEPYRPPSPGWDRGTVDRPSAPEQGGMMAPERTAMPTPAPGMSDEGERAAATRPRTARKTVRKATRKATTRKKT